MATTTSSIGINPAPTSQEPVQPMSAAPLNDSGWDNISEEKTASGAIIRVRQRAYEGGKLVLYEAITAKQAAGIPVYEVTSSNLIFVPVTKARGRPKKSA